MRRHVPLNAVRAFEAAARHLSVSRAATELCVTPTAITHQVRVLEDFLQVALFDRSKGRLALTVPGAAALRGLTDGLDQIEGALARLHPPPEKEEVVVGVGPSVASLWLMPKLRRFVAANPAIAVKINTLVDVNSFGGDSIDLAICNWDHHPNRRIDFLMEEEVVPVCAPALLATRGRGGDPPLAHLPLIHVDEMIKSYPNWPRYFHERKLAARNHKSGVRFTQSSLAIDAAINGYGVLLGRSRLVAAALAERRLVAIDAAYSERYKYFVVRQPGNDSPAIARFMEWLLDEARREQVADDFSARTEEYCVARQGGRP